MISFRGLSRGALGLLTVAGLAAQAAAADEVDYSRDVRPILSDHCFACHGPDKKQRKADLRLDVRDAALAKGAIVPGRVDESELVARIVASDSEEVMPPPAARKPLSAAQFDVPKVGSPPARPTRPIGPTRRSSAPPGAGPRGPVEGAQLDRRLRPGRPGGTPDRPRLRGRSTHPDPPAVPRPYRPAAPPEEVRAFLDDKDPRAYENLVTRLVASPHYGERMATPWLDVVRYADAVGFQGDQYENAWAYRDHEVDAFNKNLPFDRFPAEQLAGDLLPDPTSEQLTATCFNRLNMMTREGRAQPKEYLANYAADRVRTVGMAWLGSTLGCCGCHDHKFDPFTTRDFYALSAFFSGVKQWGVYNDYGYTPNPDLKGYTNDHPFPPEVVVESPALRGRIVRLRGEIDVAVKQAWVEAKLRALLEGRVDSVIRGLRVLATRRSLGGKARKAVEQVADYLERNGERMKYDEYLAAGYLIGSGGVERASRHLVKNRLERAGMRWRRQGGQVAPDLRSTYVNGQWEAFWTYHMEREDGRHYGKSRRVV